LVSKTSGRLRPIVYAPKWVYGNALAGLDYPLWASSYVTGSGTASGLYPGDTSSKWSAYSGQVPLILQFTSSATIAGQTTSDANAYRGTLTELLQDLCPGWEVEDTMALTTDDITNVTNSVLAALVNLEDFNTGGGRHSHVGDGVMNTSFPSTVGGPRDLYVWQAFQRLVTDTAATRSAVTALVGNSGSVEIDVNSLAAALAPLIATQVASSVIAALPGSDTATQEMVTAAVNAAVENAAQVVANAFAPEPTN
jgi:hypothetical protein